MPNVGRVVPAGGCGSRTDFYDTGGTCRSGVLMYALTQASGTPD